MESDQCYLGYGVISPVHQFCIFATVEVWCFTFSFCSWIKNEVSSVCWILKVTNRPLYALTGRRRFIISSAWRLLLMAAFVCQLSSPNRVNLQDHWDWFCLESAVAVVMAAVAVGMVAVGVGVVAVTAVMVSIKLCLLKVEIGVFLYSI